MSCSQLSLPDGYTYLHETSAGEDIAKVRIADVRDEESARAWLKELQTMNNVTWRVKKTYPHCGRVNLFRIDMRCQHNTDSRAKRDKHSHKHTGCPALLRIVVKRYVKYSRSQTAAKNKSYPTIVVMDGCHNHSISDGSDLLKFRDMGTNTKQMLLDLFHRGHSASSALHCLKTDLLLENGDEFCRVAADGRFVPSLSRVQKLNDKFKRNSSDDNLVDINRLVEDYCDKDNNDGIAQYGVIGDHCFVSICSPLMRRAHRRLTEAGEVVMADAVSSVRNKKPRVYVFACSTAAGVIPLGVIVSSSEHEDVFEAALTSLKTCFPEDSFFNNDCPKVFLTTSNLKEQRVLERQFPGSVVMLCEFHVLKAVWSWLVDASNGITDPSDRQILYLQFKSLVYAFDTVTLDSLHRSIVTSPVFAKYPKFWDYLASMWHLRSNWVQCLRRNIAVHGCTSTSYKNIVFRVVNDNVFNRAQKFNLLQLVDFILTRYEAYIIQRLLDFCHGRYNNNLLRYMLRDLSGNSPPADVSELLSEVGMFQVRSRRPDTTDELCTVDVVRCFCTCAVQTGGKLCRHASAVLLHLDMRICSAYNIVNADTRSRLFEIAHASVVQTEFDEHPSGPVSMPPSPASVTSFTKISQPSANDETDIPLQLNAEEQGRLQRIFDRVNSGLVSNPTLFVPAVRKMLENIRRYDASETDLANAISTFGEPSAHHHYSNAKK